MSLTDQQRDSLLAWVSFDTDQAEEGFLEEVESLIALGAAQELRLVELEIRDARTVDLTTQAAVCAVLRGRASRLEASA